MKILQCKVLVAITLMLVNVVPAHSAEVFSHTVLSLPRALSSDKPWVKIIRNQTDWESYFYATTAAITYPESMAPIAPVLDFENYQVISGGLGGRSSGGYSIAIDSVHELESSMVVHVLDVIPGPGCVVSFWLTNPSITFLVKKTDKPIKFTVSTLINPCAE